MERNTNTSNAPMSYFLVNPEGLEEVRNLNKDIHATLETLQQKMSEIREAIPL